MPLTPSRRIHSLQSDSTREEACWELLLSPLSLVFLNDVGFGNSDKVCLSVERRSKRNKNVIVLLLPFCSSKQLPLLLLLLFFATCVLLLNFPFPFSTRLSLSLHLDSFFSSFIPFVTRLLLLLSGCERESKYVKRKALLNCWFVNFLRTLYSVRLSVLVVASALGTIRAHICIHAYQISLQRWKHIHKIKLFLPIVLVSHYNLLCVMTWLIFVYISLDGGGGSSSDVVMN